MQNNPLPLYKRVTRIFSFCFVFSKEADMIPAGVVFANIFGLDDILPGQDPEVSMTVFFSTARRHDVSGRYVYPLW